MINVLADQYLYNIQSYLPENINLTLFDPSEGLPDDFSRANALLVRTVIAINKQTIPDIPESLSFIGTASAGTDHVDIDYLKNHGIQFADAAGCNARSVAEYVVTAMLIWSEEREKELSNLSVGVIGAGHVGSQVIEVLTKLGIKTVAYDPPREIREDEFSSSTIEQALETDILSFHTPLNREGRYPTYHWLEEEKLSAHTIELVINTSRGGVIDETALLDAVETGSVGDIIIDVWENEPIFNLTTAEKAFIKTPHIAGYSEQAKNNASKFVADALLNYFGLSHPKKQHESHARIIRDDISPAGSLTELLTELHPIKKYEKELQKIIRDHADERGNYFNKLRAEFPLRQEFSETYLPKSYFERFPVLAALGFSPAE